MASIGHHVSTPDGSVELSVLVAGKPQELWSQPYTGDTYVAGEPGVAYTLLVTNQRSGRVEVINTIDGRNTLVDEPGDVYRNTGLVFPSHGKGEFSGWRVDDDTTKEFVFADPEVSIAKQATDSTSNVGVIGFAVYREYVRPTPPVYRASYGSGGVLRGFEAFGGGDGTKGIAADLGTAAGADVHDHVGRTTFRRASGEPSIALIYYGSREALVAQGIITRPKPNAFPGFAPTGYGSYTSVRG